MGEIGFARKEYLYDLTWCDMILIERGYSRRNREMWSASRWSTYNVMMAFCGSEGLAKSGINNPKDLLQFPWEKQTVIITDNERESLLAELKAINKNKGKPQP